MTSTTIKVDSALRDRLKKQAQQADRTLGGHLADLADLADRQARFAALRESIARTPPDELASWRAESAELERLEAPLGD